MRRKHSASIALTPSPRNLKPESPTCRKHAASAALNIGKGAHGDWTGGDHLLSDLPRLLSESGMLSELTRILTDARYLERRCGQIDALISDFDRAEAALNTLVSLERFQDRSAESRAALSRRAYLRELAIDVGKAARRGDMYASLAKGKEGGAGSGVARTAAAGFAQYVRDASEWLRSRESPSNYPQELKIRLIDEAHNLIQKPGGRKSLSEGLCREFSAAAYVSTARLSVVIEDGGEDGNFAVVHVSPREGRKEPESSEVVPKP